MQQALELAEGRRLELCKMDKALKEAQNDIQEKNMQIYFMQLELKHCRSNFSTPAPILVLLNKTK